MPSPCVHGFFLLTLALRIAPPRASRSFTSGRFMRFYRKMTIGQNTVRFNDANQRLLNPGDLPHTVASHALGEDGSLNATLDISRAYRSPVSRVRRAFEYRAGAGMGEPLLRVTDSFGTAPGVSGVPSNLSIAFHTYGRVTLDAPALEAPSVVRSVVIQMDADARQGVGPVALRLAIEDSTACAQARLRVTPVRLGEPQISTPGLSRIDVFVDRPFASASRCSWVTTSLTRVPVASASPTPSPSATRTRSRPRTPSRKRPSPSRSRKRKLMR